MDECNCDYHHGLWMTCPYCTRRLEDDYFKAIVLAAKMGGGITRFGYSPTVELDIQVFACMLTAEERDARFEAMRKAVVEGRGSR